MFADAVQVVGQRNERGVDKPLPPIQGRRTRRTIEFDTGQMDQLTHPLVLAHKPEFLDLNRQRRHSRLVQTPRHRQHPLRNPIIPNRRASFSDRFQTPHHLVVEQLGPNAHGIRLLKVFRGA